MHSGIVAAAAVHNLSLAVAYGGSIYGRMALRRATIESVSDPKQRGKLLSQAWTRFNRVNVPAHALFTATWLIERSAINHAPFASNRTRRLVAVKDLLVTGALISGVSNVIAGEMMKKEFPEGVAITDNGNVSTEQAQKAQKYLDYFRVMGPLNTALVGGSIILGPVIGASIHRNARTGLIGKLLKNLSRG
jgi:uncharacterized membrane protein